MKNILENFVRMNVINSYNNVGGIPLQFPRCVTVRRVQAKQSVPWGIW